MPKDIEVGYRGPFTYRSLPVIESLRLTNHVLNVEALAKNYRNQELHQYLHLLSQGEDPTDCPAIFKALEQIWQKK